MQLYRIFTTYLFTILLGTTASYVSASESQDSTPHRYLVHQQQGPTCPFIPFMNLKLVQSMRASTSADMRLEIAPSFTKRQSYAIVLPHILAYDRAMDSLRTKENGAYATYEAKLREEGIHNDARYSNNGTFVDSVAWNPLNNMRREAYTPYNIKHVEEDCSFRWLPIIHNASDNSIAFFNHETGAEEKLETPKANSSHGDKDLFIIQEGNSGPQVDSILCHFSDAQIQKMGFTPAEFSNLSIRIGQSIAGSKTGYYVTNSSYDDYTQQVFYDVGTYQHMLFAMGVDKENNEIVADTPYHGAYVEFRVSMDAAPLNPWYRINKNNLFEYHLAEIFKATPTLKERAIEVLSNGLNTPWKYYQETLEYFDSLVEPRIALKDKQKYLPGENQMLAYFFSQTLRQVWAATIGNDAVLATTEADQELSTTAQWIAKTFLGASSIIKKVHKKKCGPRGAKYSFLDVWAETADLFKTRCTEELGEQRDFVSFTSHGYVISFDPMLIGQQKHQDSKTAHILGFELWDQLYDKAIRPFYRISSK